MNVTVVKEKFQEVMNAYKAQFNEDLSNAKKELFESLFQVSISETNEVTVDGIGLNVNVKECEAPIEYEIDVEELRIMYAPEKTLVLSIEWASKQVLPKITKIAKV